MHTIAQCPQPGAVIVPIVQPSPVIQSCGCNDSATLLFCHPNVIRGPSAPRGTAKGMQKINHESILPQLVLIQGNKAVQRAMQPCPVAQCCKPQAELWEQDAGIPMVQPYHRKTSAPCGQRQLFPTLPEMFFPEIP